MNRRQFLAAAGGVALAGCIGGGSGGSGGAATTTGTIYSLPDHPALAKLDGEPTRGPEPNRAPGLIVAFEDPSCPSCRRFEANTFPQVLSNLVEPGKASFVYRGVPVVAPWGADALRVMEGITASGQPGFWKLKEFYYANQRRVNPDNVYSQSASFLKENTEVAQVDGLVEAARQNKWDRNIRRDIDAAEAAGVRGTPSFFLFKEGEFLTSFSGAKSYDLFSQALQL